MRLLAHRGFWRRPEEKNTREAFVAAAQAGYGIETDVRDRAGTLVVSHDPPVGGEMTFDDFLAISGVTKHPLAVNIKADGLARPVHELLRRHHASGAFVFDMTVPDLRGHLAAGTPTFTRMSEQEREPAFLEPCAGVWLDAFATDWWDPGVVKRLLGLGKQVAIVSPELHNRPPEGVWRTLVASRLHKDPRVLLCTDRPDDVARLVAQA